MRHETSVRRYVFGEFTVSPSRRLLMRGRREVALIPRYFDVLLLLLARREEAVSRREILDRAWPDVVVSDGALSQAVRTLRRTLGDDPRNPTYIRTVSRYGYQFVFPDVEESDDAEPVEPRGGDYREETGDAESAWTILMDERQPEEARRSAAEALLRMGAAGDATRLGGGPATARALLRDARWDTPGAGVVPILGHPGAVRAMAELFRLRARRVWRAAGTRWWTALLGASAAGLVGGLVGGLTLWLGPGSRAAPTLPLTLAAIGVAIGATGAAGVAAGLCCAEVLIRSRRTLALVLFGGLGGGLVGVLAHGFGTLALRGLFGQDLSPVAGGFEGLALGAATGLGYGLATPRVGGGLATPHGGARWIVALGAGACGGVAGALLSVSGSYLGAMSLDLLAHSFPGSQVGLEPLARLLGETTPGTVTRITIGIWEGSLFAAGIVFGLTHRPKG